MSLLAIGGLLLFLMLLLLSGGVWIAMTLAIVGWVGQAFFTSTQPGKNLFSAFWESNASWELAALPLFIWMGEILFRTRLSEEMFEGPVRLHVFAIDVGDDREGGRQPEERSVAFVRLDHDGREHVQDRFREAADGLRQRLGRAVVPVRARRRARPA